VKLVLAALALVLSLVLLSADALLARPMRSWATRMMNARLNGYTVQIGKVEPHLWRMGFDLDDLVLVQNMHPDPPVADIRGLEFQVDARELLHLAAVGTLTIDHPALHINQAQILEEANSHLTLKEQGWQSAVEAVFPIKLNQVEVQDGSLLYLSVDTASKPLQITKVAMVVENLRNIASVSGTYPSPVVFDGVLFDTGLVHFEGAADFLREPYAAARGEIRLTHVPLDRLAPLAHDYQLKTSGGFLSVEGSVEYTPESQMAHLTEVLVEDLRADFVTSNATKALEERHRQEALELARSVRNAPHLILRVDNLSLTGAEIGFIDEATNPSYRMYISDANVAVTNLGNRPDIGRTEFHASGAFMGRGTTVISGGARITASPADFDVHLALENARLADINHFLLAYLGLDVASGRFSVYSEFTVKNGRMDGYVKPMFGDLKIFDRKKDRGKPFGKRMEMHGLQIVANVLENRSSHELATVIRISGPTDDPKLRGWKAIWGLVGNGFVEALRPGFLGSREARGSPKAPRKH
jgi:hypothetical protein